jgi:hypothetical protein
VCSAVHVGGDEGDLVSEAVGFAELGHDGLRLK